MEVLLYNQHATLIVVVGREFWGNRVMEEGSQYARAVVTYCIIDLEATTPLTAFEHLKATQRVLSKVESTPLYSISLMPFRHAILTLSLFREKVSS